MFKQKGTPEETDIRSSNRLAVANLGNDSEEYQDSSHQSELPSSEVQALQDEAEASKRVEFNNKKKLLEWVIASKIVQAYGILMWEEPLAIPKETIARLEGHHIYDTLELQLNSQIHEDDEEEKYDRTQAAFEAFNAIPVEYRDVLRALTDIEYRLLDLHTGDAPILYPGLTKSQVRRFLAQHTTEFKEGPAKALLQRLPDVKIAVPMFQEYSTHTYEFI